MQGSRHLPQMYDPKCMTDLVKSDRFLAAKTGWLFVLFSIVLISLLPCSAHAALTGDANVSQDQSTASITTPAFSTTSGNELLLAFIATGYLSGANTTVTGVSGAGL